MRTTLARRFPPGQARTLQVDGFGDPRVVVGQLRSPDVEALAGERLGIVASLDAMGLSGPLNIHFFTGPRCGADIDASGVIDFLDVVALLSARGPCPPPPADCPADVDGNGMVGLQDLLRVLSDWGECA